MRQSRRQMVIGSVCLVLLAGCGDQPASAAATVGETQIALQEVSAQLLAINEVLGAPSDSADVQQTNAILRNNLVHELVSQGAAAAGVTVTPSQIDDRLAILTETVGDQRLLEQQAAQEGLAPSMVEAEVRVSLLAEGWALKLAGDGAVPYEVQQELLFAEVQRYSNEVDPTVNPRFGVWDVNSLSIVADPNAPSAPGAPAEFGMIGQP